jgi:Zn-finger nucleic acid-binding protein
MARCPSCETQIDPRQINTVSVDEFVDAWLCPECDVILGMGEIRGERS